MKSTAEARLPREELRNFGLLIGTLFAALFAVLPLLRHRMPGSWPWVTAAVLWLAAIVWPRSLTPLHRWWTWLGHVLGWFNTRVILTLIFMLLMIPFGFVMRVLGRDRMKRGFDPNCESYRVPSPAQPPRRMEKPF